MATKKAPASPQKPPSKSASQPAARRTGKAAPAPAAAAVPASADGVLAQVRDRMDALPADRLLRPNFDVAAVATALGGLVSKLASGPLRARFLRLPKEEFDPRLLDDLGLFCRAALAVQQLRARAAAAETSVQVPYSLIEDSTALRKRMLRLVTYYFEDHIEHGPEIADIRSGTGYLDLAGDLDRLAALCESEAAVLAADTRDRRPSDVRDARACAQRIREALGALDEETLTDTWLRACTLLTQTYHEIAATGRWLLRKDPKTAEALFPLLGNIARSTPRPRAKPAPAPTPTPGP